MRHLPRFNSKHRFRPRRAGSIMPALAVALVTVLAGAALVLDRLWLDAARAELRTAAEAAALAAGRQLASDDRLRDECDPYAVQMKARFAAARIASENTAASEPLVLNTEIGGDIRFGQLIRSVETGDVQFMESESHPTSVAIRARRTRDRGTAVPLPFRTLLGPDSADVSVIVEATLDNHVVGLRPVDDLPLPTLPLAILRSSAGLVEPKSHAPNDGAAGASRRGNPDRRQQAQSWSCEIEQRRGSDQFAYDSSTGAVFEGSDGIPEITLRTASRSGNDPLTNAFVVSLLGDLTEDELQRQIREGWSVADFESHGGELMLNGGALPLAGLRGIEAALLASALEALIGQSRICLLYDKSGDDCDASATSLEVTGFVAGRVMSVRGISADVCEIVFQPAVLTTRAAVVASELSGSAMTNPAEDDSHDSGNRYIYKLRLSN